MCSSLKGFLLIVFLKATMDKWRFRFWFRGVQFISGVCCTRRRSSLQWVAQCTPGDHLRGSCTPWISSLWCAQRSSPWCDAHRGDDLCSMLHTAETISVVCDTPWRWSPRCATWRWFLQYVAHCGDHLRSVLHTTEKTLW